ncbi:MAG TPA: cytochrome b N-terminal domain-containing protein [Anaerolineae bacterium]|nr:cytochrome b N-terminal domain-containing protein [Anaerolineae bacterium]
MESATKRRRSERVGDWFDERFNVRGPLQAFLKKPVPKHALRWYFCLGGITFSLFVIQGITGILLSLYYKPTPEQAYDSILFIMNNVRFGWLIRSIHSWSATLMIAACLAHMLRVYITGAYKKPRELNWVAGVVLLLLTLTFGFTGYLLPWDQKALWGSTVGSEIMGVVPFVGEQLLALLRGGPDITGLTLTRFYGIHMLVLPVATLLFLGMHFIVIRRQGISGPL